MNKSPFPAHTCFGLRPLLVRNTDKGHFSGEKNPRITVMLLSAVIDKVQCNCYFHFSKRSNTQVVKAKRIAYIQSLCFYYDGVSRVSQMKHQIAYWHAACRRGTARHSAQCFDSIQQKKKARSEQNAAPEYVYLLPVVTFPQLWKGGGWIPWWN